MNTPPYTVAIRKEGDDLNDDKRLALERGKQFVLSIMNATIDPIPNSDGMSVVRDVVKLESGSIRDIILRSITTPFWQACIDAVNTPNSRLRVAAVGTPGIGKTTSTPWLIRMLLEEGHTVVYLIRSERKSKWYYEFNSNKSNRTITVNVHPETIPEDKIPSLKDPSSYYIVDPGKSKDNCDPPTDFEAKVILVPSPDCGHWGGSEFRKNRDGVYGEFRYFPTWSFEELLHAQPILRDDMSVDEIVDRFRKLGGVPRNIFEKKINMLLKDQDNAINAMSFEKARRIARGSEEAFEDFGRNTKSAVLAFRLSTSDNGTFEEGESYIVSDLVVEKICSKFKSELWSLMVDLGSHGGAGAIFENITRHMIANENPTRRFDCRRCVGPGDKANYADIVRLKLGTGNKNIRHVVDPLEAAKKEANVVFHAISATNELFDFAYKDSKGHFHVFQATVGKTHTANVKAIRKHERKVGGALKLSLYYLVPCENFRTFITKPVNPKKTGKLSCQIYHVSIPNPLLEQIGAPLEQGDEDSESHKKQSTTVAKAKTNKGETENSRKRKAPEVTINKGKKWEGRKRTKKSSS